MALSTTPDSMSEKSRPSSPIPRPEAVLAPPPMRPNRGLTLQIPTNDSDDKDKEKDSDDDDDDDHHVSLREVADKVPFSVWLVLIVSTSERFAFYGLQAPFQNYLQNPRDDPLRPGALGLGQATATSLTYLFSCLVYVGPVLTAPVIDGYLGRYKGMIVFTCVYLVGGLILLLTSLPASLDAGAGFPGFIVSVFIIAIGLGGVKACMSPFMADQYTNYEDKVQTTKSGEKVLVTRALTIEYMYSLYYWAINIGSLAGIASTFLEKDVGYWAAYLCPFLVLWVSGISLVVFHKSFVKKPPGTNVLSKASKVCMYAAKHGWKMDNARPSVASDTVPWDDQFVSDLKRALNACKVFCAYPILWLLHTQILNNLVSQAGTMEDDGLPNDIFMNLNPLAVLVFLPFVQHVLYPQIRKFGKNYGPIARMTTGFIIEAGAIAYCAGVQKMIYSSGPCYDYPLECPASQGGLIPNHISVWIQTPIYAIDAFGEIFFDLTSQEFAYNSAPENMKSIVQAILSLMSGLGAALGWVLIPATKNPNLVIMFACMSGAMGLATLLFWLTFHKYDAQMAKENKLQEPPLQPSAVGGVGEIPLTLTPV